jgi:acyl-coenzyme A thioesterase PaaI-like protein
MKIDTHRQIDPTLCGNPLFVEDGDSGVELVTTAQMAADQQGLVHGGFIFSAADYAAMIAVNHPHVVLGACDVKFLKPVRVGETVMVQRDRSRRSKGKKYWVSVSATKDADEVIFQGMFTCFVLDKHVQSDTEYEEPTSDVR